MAQTLPLTVPEAILISPEAPDRLMPFADSILPSVFTRIFTPEAPTTAFTPEAPPEMLTSPEMVTAASFATTTPEALSGTLTVPEPLSVRLPLSTWKTEASA